MNNEKFQEIQLIQSIKYFYQERQSIDNYLLGYISKMINNRKIEDSSFLVKQEIL